MRFVLCGALLLVLLAVAGCGPSTQQTVNYGFGVTICKDGDPAPLAVNDMGGLPTLPVGTTFHAVVSWREPPPFTPIIEVATSGDPIITQPDPTKLEFQITGAGSTKLSFHARDSEFGNQYTKEFWVYGE